MSFDWKTEIGERAKYAAKMGWKYRNAGSALIGAVGFPAVAAFLASPQLEGYVQRYGVSVEDAWDSMFDGDFIGAGGAVFNALSDFMSDSGYVPAVIKDFIPGMGGGGGGKWSVEDIRVLFDKKMIPPPDAIRGNDQLDGRFEDDNEGGSLLSPAYGDINEEEIVCIKKSDLNLMINPALNERINSRRPAEVGIGGSLPSTGSEKDGGGGGLLMLAALGGAGYLGYRMLKKRS